VAILKKKKKNQHSFRELLFSLPFGFFGVYSFEETICLWLFLTPSPWILLDIIPFYVLSPKERDLNRAKG